MQLLLDREAEKLVPGGVELDLVDPVAEAVVGAQLRRVLVRRRPKGEDPLRSGQRPDGRDPLLCPVGPLAPHRLPQRLVSLEDVVVDQRRWLVEDLVGS